MSVKRTPPQQLLPGSSLMECTPPQQILSGAYPSGTDQESDSNITSRRQKRRRSPEMEIAITLNNFKQDINEHITSLFSSFQSDQDKKFSVLQAGINSLSEEINEIKIETTKKIEEVSQNYKNMCTLTQNVEKKCGENSQQIKQLEDKILDLQRQTYKYKLEIRNIPSLQNETREELSKIISSVSAKINVDLAPADLREFYRLPGKPGSPKPIIIEVTTTEKKQSILQGLKKFNKSNEPKLNTAHLGIDGEVKPVYISEYLTNYDSTLFFHARQFAKHYKYAFCWTAHGVVFLRKEDGAKRIRVSSKETLKELEELSS